MTNQSSGKTLQAPETAHCHALFGNSQKDVHEIDLNGCIRAINRADSQLPGVVNSQEILGKPFLQFMSEHDRERVEHLMIQAYAGKRVEFDFQDINGKSNSYGFVPVSDDNKVIHLLGLTQDISERKQHEQQLSELEARHSFILESAGEGIYGLDKDGCLTFGNAAAERIVGWDTESVLGQKSHDVHHHSRPDGTIYPREDCPIYAALKDGEVHHVEDEVFWHADGHPVPVEYTSTPILQDEIPVGAVVVFRDVSERRELERQRTAAFDEIRRLKEQLEQERDYLRDEVNFASHFGEIIGESPALKATLKQLEAVAPTPANVLILGESGVGKELIARAIHTRSDRADKALVKVNCASIPKDLFESEFFGHVKGAFTGAHRDRVGRLQLAAGGTLFLDEVGEIPLSQQGKLLRALQEHEFERVGDDQTTTVDVRVVAATNRDLSKEVKTGRFREDLFYRLSVFPIEVPPLRARIDDIEPLAVHFLNVICRDFGRDPLRITQQQLQTLKRYDWPGNIRELKNVIERAIISSPDKRLRLDLALPEANDSLLATPAEPTSSEPDFVTDSEFRILEKANIIAALRHADWKIWGKSGAAALLGLNPSTLKYRMKQLEIQKNTAAMRD